MCKVIELFSQVEAKGIDTTPTIKVLNELASIVEAKGITTAEELKLEIDKKITMEEVKQQIQEENIARLKEMVEGADYYFIYKGIRSFVDCDIDDILATTKKVDLVSEHGQYANLIMWDGEEATIEVI